MNMDHVRFPIGIYEKALPAGSWDYMLSTAARLGFDHFEISLDESDMRLSRLEWTSASCASLRQCAQDAGIGLFSACLSGHRRFPLGSSDPAIAQKAMELMRNAIIFCGRVGIRVLQVMSYDVFYEPSTSQTLQRYLDRMAECCKWACAYGVMLAIEPIEHTHFQSAVKAMEIVKYCDSPWISLYPDVANMAAVGIDPIPELEACMSHIVAIHLREARPEFFHNVPFGTGIVPFQKLFDMLNRQRYTGPVHLEIWHDPSWGSELGFLQESLNYIKQYC